MGINATVPEARLEVLILHQVLFTAQLFIKLIKKFECIFYEIDFFW